MFRQAFIILSGFLMGELLAPPTDKLHNLKVAVALQSATRLPIVLNKIIAEYSKRGISFVLECEDDEPDAPHSSGYDAPDFAHSDSSMELSRAGQYLLDESLENHLEYCDDDVLVFENISLGQMPEIVSYFHTINCSIELYFNNTEDYCFSEEEKMRIPFFNDFPSKDITYNFPFDLTIKLNPKNIKASLEHKKQREKSALCMSNWLTRKKKRC